MAHPIMPGVNDVSHHVTENLTNAQGQPSEPVPQRLS